ncbi:MAG: diguanylate cyclase [Halothiobacillaceae bacterium]|nr:diguanylate cyclase [Halothiobacillaceae bacterium]
MIILAGVAGLFMLVWSYVGSYQQLISSTQVAAISHLAVEYRLLDRHQAELAQQVVEDLIDRPAILRLLAEAAHAPNAATRAPLRRELHDRLTPTYERMRDKGFDQLHFHLPGAISFLRFDRPDRYDDRLWKTRPGIARVHLERRPVSGFEEGRLSGGFRYLFPLFFEGEFVGSVEASYAFRSFLSDYADGPEVGYRLLLPRDAVANRAADAAERDYIDSQLHPDFVVDRQDEPGTGGDGVAGLPGGEWSAKRLSAVGRSLPSAVRDRMDRGERFAEVTRQPEPAVVAFLPVQTTEGTVGGYLLRYAPAPEVAQAWSSLWIKGGLAAVMVLITLGSLLYLSWRESARQLERERWLQLLNEAQRIAQVGNWAFDVQSGALTWSDQVFRLFGYPPRSFSPTYERFLEIVHPHDRERVSGAVAEALETGRAYQVTHRVVLPDGHTRYIHERAALERDEKSQAVVIVGTAQDISDQVAAEKESREAATILYSTREGVIIASEVGHVLSANPAVERLLGLDEKALVGRLVDELIVDHEQSTPFAEVRERLDGRGSWEGELWLRRFGDGTDFFPARATFTAITSDMEERRFVVMFSDISEAKAREWAMWHQAHHDALTGLANRTLFQERLERALSAAERHGERVGVLYLDLDGFKPINDTYGHEVGDDLLIVLAQRLLEVTREEDTVSRQGGDEFAVLVARPATPEAVETVAEKVVEAIHGPVQVGRLTLHPRASIGVAVYPDHGTTVEALIAAADESMYRQKQGRKGEAGGLID